MKRLIVIVALMAVAGCASFPQAPPGISSECARECRREWNGCMYAEGAQGATVFYCNAMINECYRMCPQRIQ